MYYKLYKIKRNNEDIEIYSPYLFIQYPYPYLENPAAPQLAGVLGVHGTPK